MIILKSIKFSHLFSSFKSKMLMNRLNFVKKQSLFVPISSSIVSSFNVTLRCSNKMHSCWKQFHTLSMNGTVSVLQKCSQSNRQRSFSPSGRRISFDRENLLHFIERKMSDEKAKAQTAGPEEETIFGKIVKGIIPTKFLYEDDLVI